MPSFPTSVYAPASKSAGQTIQAAHVNDLDSEVNAIEDGYLNATARMNSSALNVTAGSTFAVRPVTPPPDFGLYFFDSTIAVASSGDSTLAWTGISTQTNSSLHSTGTNPERITPQSTGIYEATAQVAYNPISSGQQVGLILEDSSAGAIGRTVRSQPASPAGLTPTIQVRGYKRFDVTGGFVRARWVADGVSTQSLSSGIAVSYFSLAKL